jgi:hypothetical protein
LQTLLPLIAVVVLLALLSGQYLRAARRNSDGSGYVLSYPKVVTVSASAGILMVLAFASGTVYAFAVGEIRFALILMAATAAFGALGYFALRQALTRITVDDSGITLHAWSKHVYVPWNQATVDSVTRPQCAVITNAAGQEIRVYESMVGAGIIEDYVRRHVTRDRIRFIRNLAGEFQLFYRDPSNNRWRGP